MNYDEVIYLINEAENKNSFGEAITPTIPTEKMVYADLKEVKRSEFYQSSVAGYNPKYVFKIRYSEYNKEKKVRFGTETLRVIRDYSKDKEFVELICEEWVA